jgi:hypothetical protein
MPAPILNLSCPHVFALLLGSVILVLASSTSAIELAPGDLVVLERQLKLHRIDPITGDRELFFDESVPGIFESIVVTPDRKILVLASSTQGPLVRVDPATGDYEVLPLEVRPSSTMALAPDGDLYVVAFGPTTSVLDVEGVEYQLMRVDPDTGSATTVAPTFSSSIAVSTCGDAIVGPELERVSVATGLRMSIPSEVSLSPAPRSMASSSTGALVLLEPPDDSDTVPIVRLDPASGTTELVSSVQTFESSTPLALGLDDEIYVVTRHRFGRHLLRFDPDTGEQTHVTGLGALARHPEALAVVPDDTPPTRRELWRTALRCRLERWQLYFDVLRGFPMPRSR